MKDIKTTLVAKWFEEVWNKGRSAAIDQLLAPEIMAYGLGTVGHLKGIEAFKSFYEDFKMQLNNVEVVVENVVSEEDMEAAFCKVTAIDAASGKALAFSGMCMIKIKDGKIAEAWNNFDFLTMYQQMGFEFKAR